MCGLLAVIPTVDVNDTTATEIRMLVRLLGLKNDARGGHSWGIWSEQFLPWRGLGEMAEEGVNQLVSYTNQWIPRKDNWIAGHTRFGTHGKNTVENAHPFEEGEFTLAHNGVINVESKDAYVNAHPVDSGNLARNIALLGIKEGIASASGMLGLLFNGADRRLIAYRSNQVLAYAQTDWGYVVSSDKTHLADCLALVGMDVVGKIMEFTSETLQAPWYPDFVEEKAPSAGANRWSDWDALYPTEAGSWSEYHKGNSYGGSSGFGKSYGHNNITPHKTGGASVTINTPVRKKIKSLAADDAAPEGHSEQAVYRYYDYDNEVAKWNPEVGFWKIYKAGDVGFAASLTAYFEQAEADGTARYNFATQSFELISDYLGLPCEMCSTHYMDESARFWTDPDSYRDYEVCGHCLDGLPLGYYDRVAEELSEDRMQDAYDDELMDAAERLDAVMVPR